MPIANPLSKPKRKPKPVQIPAKLTKEEIQFTLRNWHLPDSAYESALEEFRKTHSRPPLDQVVLNPIDHSDQEDLDQTDHSDQEEQK